MIFSLASEDVVFEEFDGDLVVLDLATGRYFGFNDAATALWRALVDGASVEDLVAAAPSVDGIGAFVTRLVEAGLLTASEVPSASADLSALGALAGAPTVEVYDDLSDLILADPIHDVDAEAGWPKAMTATG